MGGGATKPAAAGGNNDDNRTDDNLIKFFGLDNSGKSLLLELIKRVSSAGDDSSQNDTALLPMPTRLSVPQNLPAINIDNTSVVLQNNPGHASCRKQCLSKGNGNSSCTGIVFVLDVEDQLRFGVALNFLRCVIDSHVPGRPVLLVMAKRGGANLTDSASLATDQVKRYGVIPPTTPWKSKPVVLPEVDPPVGSALFDERGAEEKTSAPPQNQEVGLEFMTEMNWLLSAANNNKRNGLHE